MSLPRAVEAQGRRADELLAARNRGNTEQPAPAPVAATPPAAPLEAPKEPAAPAASTPTAPAPAQPSEAEQRLRVLQGKYNAEVPRMAAELKAANDAKARLEERISALEAESRKKPLITEEEVKEFGEPLVDMARRAAREENRATVEENAKLRTELDQVRAQVGKTQEVGQRLNTQSFFDALTVKQPDWQEVNTQPAFLKWLDEVDPLAGRPRQEILDEAQNALDANRVAAFFAQWKAGTQARAASASAALDEQVTPSSAPSSPPASPEKKIWTAAEITKFYDDVRRGRYKTEEAERIELDIQAAPREGRYRAK